MASCRCGADVDYVRERMTLERFALDTFSVTEGERFTITDYRTDPWVAVKIDPVQPVAGQPPHRLTCPLQQ